VDGRVIFQGPWESMIPKDIIEIVPDNGWDSHVMTLKDECHVIEYKRSAKGEGILELPFGRPVGLVERWMALVKIASMVQTLPSLCWATAKLGYSAVDGSASWHEEHFYSKGCSSCYVSARK